VSTVCKGKFRGAAALLGLLSQVGAVDVPAQSLDAAAVAACDAAETGAVEDPADRLALGVCHLLGKGRYVDHRRALALFRSAAQEGSDDARFALAAAQLFRVRDPSRYEESVAALQSLAASGYGRAHFPLAVALKAGLGVPQNLSGAVTNLVAASEAGDDVAAYVLAVAYRYGLLQVNATPELAYGYVQRYLAIVAERFPGEEMSPDSFVDRVLALHHDRLLRDFMFTDDQLELFLGLAREVLSRGDLSRLRRGLTAPS
jgi:hypothetical protein